MDSSGGVSVTDPVERRVSSERGGADVFVREALFFLSLFEDLADDVEDDEEVVVAVLLIVFLGIDTIFLVSKESLGDMGAVLAVKEAM